MSLSTIIILGILASIGVYIVIIYNGLIFLKNNIEKNWSNIEVLLKQRNAELPKLIATCKEYMKHEQKTLEELTAARTQAMTASEGMHMQALGEAETLIRSGLGKLFAVAENYPDLKANTNFIQLQSRISDLEDGIADRREMYNEM